MLKKNLCINKSITVIEAMKKLDQTAEKVLFVVNSKNQFLGTITDGDIRRHILKGKGLKSNISAIYNAEAVYLDKKQFSVDTVRELLLKDKIPVLPIVDKDLKVIDYVTWECVYSDTEEYIKKPKSLGIPVVIMAGGKGTRLEPFTKILPKPLIPLGETPIIEIIMDGMKLQGIDDFLLTLNHKGEMIEAYLSSSKKGYNYQLIWEQEFLGTAGSLKLCEDKLKDHFIVTNCDVIVKADLEEVLSHHIKQKALLTIVSAIQHYKIPYGVIDFKEHGQVVSINEKPEYSFTVNTGCYFLSKEALKYIPKNKFFHMTDLIDTLLNNNEKVAAYPINEGEYIDIGQWEEYKQAVNRIVI